MIPTRANQTVLGNSRVIGFNPRTGSALVMKFCKHGELKRGLYRYRVPHLSEALRFKHEIVYFMKGQQEITVFDPVTTRSFGVLNLHTQTFNFNFNTIDKYVLVAEISARRLCKM